ncbi:nitrilase-related carbon-nitrogen hydrolase [Streptomyces jumonjinensis]|uniref:nitrilase-related carbon-nitrogen hydrolase n=1 Tax=Streptomyces jumonjinensis TaxID=1945 RepID=UPI002B219D0D|nr:nitrilase-related carbon-nitrogen hydrolase [Streptomyces jumonjinensis]
MSPAPYTAVGLIPEITEIQNRADIHTNLQRLHRLARSAVSMGSLDLPVRLLVLPEGSLQGFADEIHDLDHETYARACAIDIPGPETQELASWARKFDVYLMAQAKARHPYFPGRYFNVGFVINPSGEIILRHHKLTPLPLIEHSMSPHDVFDRWTEIYGRCLNAFWPVADTPIGRLGVMMANEAAFPENARALALNGCEIAYRTSYPLPGVASGAFEIQNRARALDNGMYVLAPNPAAYTGRDGHRVDFFGGQSTITDPFGQTAGRVDHGGVATFVTATIDIAALRRRRTTAAWTNNAKDLRTELYRIVYDKPIYPKNLYAERPPYRHGPYLEKVTLPQIELMRRRGIWR